LKFWGPGVEPSRGKPCPSVVVYLGDDVSAFEREFEREFGQVQGRRLAWQRERQRAAKPTANRKNISVPRHAPHMAKRPARRRA